jgi:hypothetical protein
VHCSAEAITSSSPHWADSPVGSSGSVDNYEGLQWSVVTFPFSNIALASLAVRPETSTDVLNSGKEAKGMFCGGVMLGRLYGFTPAAVVDVGGHLWTKDSKGSCKCCKCWEFRICIVVTSVRLSMTGSWEINL